MAAIKSNVLQPKTLFIAHDSTIPANFPTMMFFLLVVGPAPGTKDTGTQTPKPPIPSVDPPMPPPTGKCSLF